MSTIDLELVRKERCAAAFGRMSWAFLFVILDITFSVNDVRIDVLPDVVGWCIFAVSLLEISTAMPEMRKLQVISCVLALLTFLQLIQFGQGSLQIVTEIGTLVFVWMLLGQIMKLADALGDYSIRHRALASRLFYLCIPLFALAEIPIVLVAPVLIIPIFFSGIILMIIVLAKFMGLMRRVDVLCLHGELGDEIRLRTPD